MILFTYLSLAVLGLCYYVGFSLVTGFSLVAVCGLLLAVASLVAEHGLEGALATVVGAHGLSCSTACGSFLDQGSNPCLLHWQVDSLPLSHQGSPICYIYFKCLFLWFISFFFFFLWYRFFCPFPFFYNSYPTQTSQYFSLLDSCVLGTANDLGWQCVLGQSESLSESNHSTFPLPTRQYSFSVNLPEPPPQTLSFPGAASLS